MTRMTAFHSIAYLQASHEGFEVQGEEYLLLNVEHILSEQCIKNTRTDTCMLIHDDH